MIVPPSLVALPAVQTVTDCADFSLSIVPYLPQLRQLPQLVWQHIADADALRALYVSTNPAITALAFALFLTPLVLVVSEFNRNYSQVDRLWSFLPAIYNAHYTLWAHMAGLHTEKLDHIMAISTLWSIRLTFNYWRKGGYSVGSEDYRWEVLKPILGPTLMFIFNVLFISLAQNLLLFAITTPTYIILLTSRVIGSEMGTVDNVFSRLMFFLVLVEFFADQQQWNFQQAKKKYQNTAKPASNYTREALDRGFVTSGLWAYSRHPNFAAEQAFWVALYQWGCFQTEVFANWTFVGAIGYLVLFQASTWFTERITAKKYSDYKIYQKSVGKFLPGWNSKSGSQFP
ncbi:DUF1295-domain-containing protein [Mytilinidion resinicola]|uniref:DUF1295-domain-containing protein n=1 Tax=Mytilinidion resinicola TaxID=574789 RepID=A0A6A6Y2C5_9PEZI|nr:DUF1295-domain-containing protein [Mytilinidion resinicola]KAF2802961.1 DUF1295-domain-containing protein [Mytilinidion resinicola]